MKQDVSCHETGTFKCGLDASVCNDKQLGIMINADVNGKNLQAKADVMMDLFKILVHVNVILQNI